MYAKATRTIMDPLIVECLLYQLKATLENDSVCQQEPTSEQEDEYRQTLSKLQDEHRRPIRDYMDAEFNV